MASTLLALITTTAGISWLLSCAMKAAFVLAASWLGATMLRRSTAAARHQMWAVGVIGALLVPMLCWLIPALLSSLSPSPDGSPPGVVGPSTFSMQSTFPAIGPEAASVSTWSLGLAIAWAIGLVIVAANVVRAHLAARRLLRTADPKVPDAWSAILGDAATSLGVTRSIELRASDRIESPMTIGVTTPRVLLPASARSWSTARLRAALVHELGHIRRRDTLTQLVAQVACAAYWWNPLAWLAAARLRAEREHACDDLVIDAGTLPSSYAGDLLAVARSLSTRPQARAATMCMADTSSTEIRLRRILDASTPRQPVTRRLQVAIASVTVACSMVVGCTSTRPDLPAGTSARDVESANRSGTVTIGAPSLREPTPTDVLVVQPSPAIAREGAVDLTLVAAEVERRRATVDDCYAQRLADKPTLSGTVVLHWAIDEAGNAREACITNDSAHDRELTACVTRLVLQGGRFPSATGGAVDVEVPFVFTSHAPIATR